MTEQKQHRIEVVSWAEGGHKPTCSCGWQSAEGYQSETAAREVGERHAQQAD
jgi:hypothetical protein